MGFRDVLRTINEGPLEGNEKFEAIDKAHEMFVKHVVRSASNRLLVNLEKDSGIKFTPRMKQRVLKKTLK